MRGDRPSRKKQWVAGILALLAIPAIAYASVTVSINGTNYTIPQKNEKGWGDNVTAWIQAISASTLQPSGGTFTLSNDVDFGASFGLKSTYYKTRTANIATTGQFRAANTDTICFRNNANGANLCLGPNTGTNGVISYNSVDLVGTSLAQTLTNKTFDASLNTVSNIADANVAAAAAIARSKVANGTANHVVINNGSGTLSSEAQLAITRGGTGAGTAAGGFDALAPTTTNGDIIARAGGTNARVGIGSSGQVLKVVGGAPTWATFSGGINYLSSNPDAETDTSGWATYADAAGATPVDATGGSPTTTWTRTTSSPLRGTGSFLLTKDAANRQGEGASFAFTIDTADQGKPIAISFDYTIASGTYADGDLTVYVYDVTNAQVIQLAPYKILSATAALPQKWIGYFQSASNSTSYRLAVHVASTSASAYTVKFDNWIDGPTYQPYGSAGTDWISFTPTGSWVSNTTYTGYWRRKGDSVDVWYQLLLTGAPTSATLTVNMPTGITIDTTKLPSTSGFVLFGGLQGKSAGNIFAGATQINNSTSLAPVYLLDGTTASIMKYGSITQAAPYTFANADLLIFYATDIPIAGWSSNVQVSTDADTRVVAFRATNSAGTTLTKSANNTVPYATVDYDTHGAWNGTNTYTCPVPGKYAVKANINIAAGATWAASDYVELDVWKNGAAHTVMVQSIYAADAASVKPGNVTGTVNCSAGETITINAFPSKASVGNVTLNTSGPLNTLSIERLSGPAQISASETVAASYTNYTNSGAVSSGTPDTLVWSTKVLDTHNAMSAGTYTIPAPGTYDVICSAEGSTTVTNPHDITVSVYVDGNQKTTGGTYTETTTSGRALNPKAHYLARLTAGQAITCRSVAAFGQMNYVQNDNYDYFQIKRIGL